MKFLIIALLFSVQTWAQMQIKSDFSGTSDATYVIVNEQSNTTECYGSAARDSSHSSGQQKLSIVSGNQQLNSNGVLKWVARLATPFSVQARLLTLHASGSLSEDKSTILVSVAQYFQPAKNRIHEDHCGDTIGYLHQTNGNLSGLLEAKFTNPAGSWLVKLNRQATTGIFAENYLQSTKGSLMDPHFTKGKLPEEFLWVKPEAQLAFEYSFKDLLLGVNEIGRLHLDLEPVKYVVEVELPADPPTPAQVRDGITPERKKEKIKSPYLKELKENLHSLTTQDLNDDKNILKWVEVFASVFNEKKNMAEISKSLYGDQILKISNRLFQLANAVIPNQRYGLLFKTSAAVASFEMANWLIEEIEPLCKVVTVVKPLSETKYQEMGFKAVSTFLDRAHNRVSKYNLAAYGPLLNKLSQLSAGKVTYGQANADPELRKQLLAIIRLLQTSVRMNDNPFGLASRDLLTISKSYSDLSRTPEWTTELISSLNSLGFQEQEFVANLSTLVLNIESPQSLDKTQIQIPGMNERLAKLISGRSLIQKNMEKQLRLLSLVDFSGPELPLIDRLMHLISHQVAVFEKPFRVEDMPYFEPIRAAYVENKNLTERSKKLNECLQTWMK